MDLRPGGIFHYRMETADGGEIWGKMVYREITPRDRIVFLNSFSDEAGGTTHHPMAPTWPLEMLSIFTFEDVARRQDPVHGPLVAAQCDRGRAQDLRHHATTACARAGAERSTSSRAICRRHARHDSGSRHIRAAGSSRSSFKDL